MSEPTHPGSEALVEEEREPTLEEKLVHPDLHTQELAREFYRQIYDRCGAEVGEAAHPSILAALEAAVVPEGISGSAPSDLPIPEEPEAEPKDSDTDTDREEPPAVRRLTHRPRRKS
jgi:hypothetical protein